MFYITKIKKTIPFAISLQEKLNCKGLLAAHNRAALSIRRNLKPKEYSYHSVINKNLEN